MTNDQLLEKLYEGSLTPDEHALLDARVAESPDFASEVQEFLTVVRLLDQEKQEERVDTAVLDSTKDKVVALIAAAGAAGTGSAVVQSGGLSSFAGAAQWILAALGAAGIGSVVLWNALSDDAASPAHTAVRDTTPVPATAPAVAGRAETPVLQQNTAPAQTEVPPPDNSRALAVHTPTPVENRGTAHSSDEERRDRAEPDENEVDDTQGVGRLDEQELANYQRELDHYKARLEQVRLTKNTSMQAQVLLNIAHTERLMRKYSDALFHADQSLELWKQLDDPSGRAAAYRYIGMINRDAKNLRVAADALAQGLQFAQSDGQEELRGLLLGELAKVYRDQGNIKLAYEKMFACVVLLRRTESAALSEWEAELQQLELALK